MKIISISDVITNSSSEVFCTIKSNSKDIIKEISECLGNLGQSEWNTGGVFRLDPTTLSIEFSNDLWSTGIDRLLKPGLEKLLEPWKGKYNIIYE